MTEPQIPRLPDLLSPAIDALLAGLPSDRARSLREWHANHGRYGDVLAGWLAMAAVARARVCRENIATRLIPENTGQPLQELCDSEFFASLASDPQYAIGECYLNRSKTNTNPGTAGNFTTGVIAAGQKFKRPTQTAATESISLSDTTYVALETVNVGGDDDAGSSPIDVGGGNWLHSQQIMVPVVAVAPGTVGNVPINGAVFELSGKLFDAAAPENERLSPVALYAAGGSTGITEQQLVAYAKAMGTGFFGANNAAAIAGCRSNPRVRYAAHCLDYTTAILTLYAADESWASSKLYRNQLKQYLSDKNWIGFGSRVEIGRVEGFPVNVQCKVYMRSRLVDSELTEVKANIRKALQSYFDNRPDFYCWRRDAIAAVIAKADQRILTCAPTPSVLFQNTVLSEPAAKIEAGATSIYHYNLVGLTVDFATVGS